MKNYKIILIACLKRLAFRFYGLLLSLEHVYKYQIDYTPVSKEYQELLKEMGYHEVKNALYDFRVLENEDEDAPDLNTEFIFDKNNKIKQFKSFAILFIQS